MSVRARHDARYQPVGCRRSLQVERGRRPLLPVLLYRAVRAFDVFGTQR
jgi:hypothetical protein